MNKIPILREKNKNVSVGSKKFDYLIDNELVLSLAFTLAQYYALSHQVG